MDSYMEDGRMMHIWHICIANLHTAPCLCTDVPCDSEDAKMYRSMDASVMT